MKRFSQVFLALTALVLMSGCAKDNYNKWLTGGTWNLTSFSQETKTVTTRTYSAAANVGLNGTITDDVLDVLASGTETYTHTNTTSPNTGTTSYVTDITISKNTSTVAFNSSGTYTWSITTQSVSTQENTTATPVGPVHNSVTPAATNSSTDDWAWLEDGAIKDQIQLNNVGNVMIKLTKSSMTWTYNPTNTKTTIGSDANGSYTDVSTTTTTNTWSFSK